MPGHLPVRRRGLVKEQTPHREGARPQHRRHERPDGRGVGELLHFRNFLQQVAPGINASLALALGILRDGGVRQGGAKICDHGIRDATRDHGESPPLEQWQPVVDFCRRGRPVHLAAGRGTWPGRLR